MQQQRRQRQRKRPPVLPRAFSQEESSTVIVGQSAPSLEDVLSGESSEQPFDLASFMVFAERRLFSEAVAFLIEVDALRRETNLHHFQRKLRHIVSEFVSEEGARQVNLSDGVRRKTEAHAAVVLDRLSMSPFAEPDRTSLDLAYCSVLKLVRDDQYLKYMDYILVQRQLRVSRLEAQWWKHKDLTAREFFTFPCPVDSIESRLHAFLAIFVATGAGLCSMLLGFPWPWLYPTYGYLARSLCGPRLDPQAFFVLFCLRPLLEKIGPLQREFLPGPPMRAAQMVAFLVSFGCTLAAFMERYKCMLGLLSLLLFSSFLWAFCNTCIVCITYLACVRAELLPPGLCTDCKIRYVEGEGPPTNLKAEALGTQLPPSASGRLSGVADVDRGGADIAGGEGGEGDICESSRGAPSLMMIRARFYRTPSFKFSPRGVEKLGGFEEEEDRRSTCGGDLQSKKNRPNSKRLGRASSSAGGAPSMTTVIEESNSTIATTAASHNRNGSGGSNDDNGKRRSPRPRSFGARSLRSYSKDITGLTTSVAMPRPGSLTLKWASGKTVADLEEYNALFSARLSRGTTADHEQSWQQGEEEREHNTGVSRPSRDATADVAWQEEDKEEREQGGFLSSSPVGGGGLSSTTPRSTGHPSSHHTFLLPNLYLVPPDATAGDVGRPPPSSGAGPGKSVHGGGGGGSDYGGSRLGGRGAGMGDSEYCDNGGQARFESDAV